ncbi:MAG: uncharacterized protein KVP18_000122 [Porospora cf. gigantea A]|uniref:uncharacterized protein n=1 Tax=Porospora cf. gigantea A TaxID=2853593 RepID=UPI003559FDFD|nr:MAG: hypothetical protein KVP18_000122 [Porospora cf. gigantea A]
MGVAAQAVLRAIDASVDLFWHADDGLVLQSNLQETIYGCSDLLHVTAFSRYCRDINAAAGVCMRRAVRHERKRALKQTELTHQVLLVHVGGLQRNKETRMHLLHEWSLPGFKDKMVLRALLQWKDPAGTPEFPPAEPPALEETWAPLQPTTQGTQAVACQTESDSEAEQTAMRLEALEGLVECLWGRSAILEPVASKREAVIDYFGLLHWYNVKIIEPLKGLLFSGRFRGQRKMAEVQRRADQLAERLADETSRRVLSEWQLSYILGESEDSNSYSRNSSSADLELCRNFAARELTGVKQTKRLERVRSTLSDASQWKSQAVSERRDAVAAQTDLISAQSEVRRLECEVVNECATLKERIERERSMRMAAECASHRYKQQVGKWVQQLEDAERAKATVHAELVNAQGNVDKLSTQLTEVAAALGQHKDSRKKIFKELSPDVMQRLAEMSR